VEKKFSLKRLIEELLGLVSKRGRIVRLIFVIVLVVLLSALLCGLMLTQLTPNYPKSSEKPNKVVPNPQANSTVPSQPIPNPQANSTVPSQPIPNPQANSTVPSQPAPNSPTTETISNVGSLKTIDIEAYWDENLTNRVNGINWGLLEPGDQKSFSIYLRNEGNSAVTLSMSASDWNPSAAATYLTLSWDYNGQIIEADKNLQVTLTLSVSANITGITNFSFDIIVVGTG
jgi:cytoskeletal protein RodZ